MILEEGKMQELDLNILKVLVTDQMMAVDFVTNNDVLLFDINMRECAGYFYNFIKAYKTLPTLRAVTGRYPEAEKEIVDLWHKISKHEYNIKDYKFDLSQIKERFKKNSVKSIHRSIEYKMDEGLEPDIILKDIALKLQKTSIIDNGRTHIQMSAADYIDEFKDIYEAKKSQTSSRITIPTGYSMIDAVTGGFSPAELILIGGETSAGKSQLLSNIAVQMWLQNNTLETPFDSFNKGYSVLYFSLEMPYEDCYNRFLAKLADIPERSIRDAKLDDSQIIKRNRAFDFINEYQNQGNHFNIVDVPRNVTIEEIELRYQDALLRFRPDIVVVDYMGLMHDRNMAKEQDWLKMGAIAASLHEFSRAYNVIMLTAVQLTDIKRNNNQKGDTEEHQRVGVHRIGRSSHIMHHVNIGIQIETRLHERSLPDMRYHIIKNRKGALGQGNLIKNFECSSLYDVPYIDPIKEQSQNIAELIKHVRDSNET